MPSFRTHLSHPAFALILTATALCSLPAQAAGATRPLSADAQYQRDTALCRSGKYAGDRADCLSEASTARASREPVSVDPDPGRYARNAVKRCEPLTEPDRSDCIARMQGKGTTSGSVAGGGISRELVTRETTPPPAVPAK
jgi:hypothetical protein